MEINELKNIWKEENVKLEQKLEINTQLLKNMNMNKVVSEFDKSLQMSINGRNAALIYGLISLIMGILLIDKPIYSFPALLGAVLMFYSFWSHLSLVKPNYEKQSMLDLQKAISKFKIHTAKNARKDIFIVGIWLLTLIPALVMYFKDYSIYANTKATIGFGLISIWIIVYVIFTSKRLFQKMEYNLKEAEDYLKEIRAFESQ